MMQSVFNITFSAVFVDGNAANFQQIFTLEKFEELLSQTSNDIVIAYIIIHYHRACIKTYRRVT